MGTRADFYLGRGPAAEWLGSIAWDGYPEGIDAAVKRAKTEADYKSALEEFFRGRDDVTTPDRGWPWPWETSKTTDYAYAFDGGKVFASCFGGPWFNPRARKRPDEDDNYDRSGPPATFPNMKDRQNVTLGKRSGLIVIQA